MYSVATPIWNQIAKEQNPKSRPWGAMMSLDEEALTKELDAMGDRLESSGVSVPVILSYQTVGPLLAENVAISRFIQTRQNPDLRSALPEVVSLSEAIILASLERDLTIADQESLHSLLMLDCVRK